MIKETQISAVQFSILLMGFILGSTVIMIPGSSAHQNAWLAYIIGWLGGLCLFSMYLLLYQRHPHKTMIEIHQILLGKWMGNILSLLYLWYFLHLGTLVLRNFAEYAITVNIPETPLWFMILLYIIAVGYSVKSGLEVTGRTAELVVPFVFLFQLAITLFLLPHMKFENLRPFLGGGFAPVLSASFAVLAFPFGETVIFLMIFPYVNHQNKIKKSFLLSFLLAGGLLLMAIFRDILILGEAGIARQVFPPHLTAKRIEFLNLDPLIGVMFFMGGGAKVCVCYLAVVIGLAQLTKSKDHRVFVYPIGVILTGLSLWIYNNAPEMLLWAVEIWPYYSIPFQIVFPIMLLMISLLKKSGKQHIKG
ncbi:GerAB/ArcD/ProY family transporter [Clostridium formicaceticum]|uniref:Spore germination protein YndE n=1 Tax=Clostridium formicaceticum TaxID=1497 RepID=A0AAC9RP87_9CLOT|nr:endospore germination permease [Clostridium formicaceticum]AOY74899.1 hypothetical protein BJL90_02355 [Clostridium formicaceticum]ARE89304.1 Spore germination protein YndE [Clostridium formicaceticum]